MVCANPLFGVLAYGESFALWQATHQWYIVPCQLPPQNIRRGGTITHNHPQSLYLAVNFWVMSEDAFFKWYSTKTIIACYNSSVSSDNSISAKHIYFFPYSTYKSEHIYFFPCVPSPHLLFATLYSFSFQDSRSCGVVINDWGWAPTPPKIRSSTSITDTFLANSYVGTVIEPRNSMQLTSIVQLGNKKNTRTPKKFAKRKNNGFMFLGIVRAWWKF